MKQIICISAVFLLMVACVKELPLNSDVYVEPKPVFHLYLEPDSVIFADFSRVTPITAKPATTDNGLISLFRNNAPEGDMPPIGNGRYYWTNNNYKPRDSFRIYASDGMYGFFVRGRVPSLTKIARLDTSTQLIAGIGPAFVIDFKFTDSAIDDNFYRIYLRRYFYEYQLDNSKNRVDSVARMRVLEIDGSERPFIQNNFNNYTSSEILFSDATFNGVDSAEFRIYTPEKIRETAESKTMRIELVLENLEKPLYDFYNTRNAHLWQQQSIAQLPGNIEGNITGGYGVAAAYTRSIGIIYVK